MDSQLMIISASIFLLSLFSLLFINKFFRRKTFEEVIAEKKALTEKIYGKRRNSVKKSQKQTNKKDLKKQKKQKQNEQQQSQQNVIAVDLERNSNVHSEVPQKLITTEKSVGNVEMELTTKTLHSNKRESLGTGVAKQSSNIDKENTSKSAKGIKEEGKRKKAPQPVQKLNVNSNSKNNLIQPVLGKVDKPILENSPVKAVSLNKVASSERLKKPLENKDLSNNQTVIKKEKNGKKNGNNGSREANEKSHNIGEHKESSPEVTVETNVVKEINKHDDDKLRNVSPKIPQQSKINKQQNKKRKDSKDATTTSLDLLIDRDVVSVSLLMNLFHRAELNRSEIQMLIDYLLNRQQDMPTNHAEWSDDVCQKLKRQLKDAEKALAEEQEASIGIQAKLRELRAEINSERATVSGTLKSYAEKLQVRDQDILLLEQKIKSLTDNLTLERQQFQTKLANEKQVATQDLLAQIQILQNDLAHKEKCVTELTCIVNASRQAVEESQQKNEIIQQQAQQLRTLEQQRDELEQISNNRIFELEKAKQMEQELSETKIELRNLQNALESAKTDANQSRLAAEAIRNDAAIAHTQLQNIASKAQEQSKEQSDLQAAYESIKQQLAEKEMQLKNGIVMEAQLQQQLINMEAASKEQVEQQLVLQNTIDMLGNQIENYKSQLIEQDQHLKQQENIIASLKNELREKETKLIDYHQLIDQIGELQKLVGILKEEITDKEGQLQQAKQRAEISNMQEQQLIEQLKEQKLKNNELRMKNWKLVEALKNAETKAINVNEKVKQINSFENINLVEQQMLLAASSKQTSNDSQNNKSESTLEEKRIRELFQRLYPDAVKACAATALCVSLDQWMEQVIIIHSKQLQQEREQSQVSSNHKSTQSSDSNYALSSSAIQNAHNGNDNYSNHPSLMTTPTIEASNTTNTTTSKTDTDIQHTDIISTGSGSGSGSDHEILLNENKLLRLRIEELTQLARKTDHVVLDLKHRVKEQDDHWRSVLQLKDDEITALRHSNGQQEDI